MCVCVCVCVCVCEKLVESNRINPFCFYLFSYLHVYTHPSTHTGPHGTTKRKK